ncbi:carbohydrate ABC transporter permease [Paenibacillus glycanilyticus]|uniref:Sugar ABC transporter permease n=1 Tax=Paenibacillus glycanilyticus TaxID=126569 RepID=A0ABQ6GC24_9BACL|nr:carbohydrate ABC transporter permease [Paenibacillus glycanilyticus]GLX68428.1 sugar ABC transporter permease [Paenibacillus glycanilyticus]
MQKAIIRESLPDRIFLLFIYLMLILILISVAYPLIFVISSSFSSSSAVIGGKVWLWPVNPTLNGYEAIYNYPEILKGFLNSVFYTVLAVLITVSLTVLMAFPLSRPNLPGKGIWMYALLFAMIFNGGLIPFYLVVRDLHMINTIWSLLIPGGLNIFSVLVAKTFFQNGIPGELYDSAQVDGCNDFRFLGIIALPLSKPILAVLVLWAAVGQWNSYFNAMIFLNNPDLFPLQLILRKILILNNVEMTSMTLSPELLLKFEDMKNLLKYALIVITSVPMLLLYPFAQKYFVQGAMIGSIKG